ncbi:hypothetical protein [Kordia sp.]|uniref:hypothetical protein n=1 Tax=Kordia sp. TaxID=1965332 RepID=UPI003B590F0F
MKSLLFPFLFFFSIFSVSAQEITEDQFIPQLQAKQKALYELVDKKDDLVIQVSNLTREIKAIKDEAEKAKKIKEKEGFENEIKELDIKITEKCDEYREYHTLLSKYQNVSNEFLANYKVRICQIYTSPAITSEEVEEVKIDSFKEKLKAKEAEIEEKVDGKFDSDKKIAVFDKEIADEESKLNDSTLEDTKRKEIEDKIKAIKKEKSTEVDDNKDLLKEIRDLCDKFEEYKTYLEKHEGVEASVLETFKGRSCLLFEEKEELDPEKFIVVGDNEPIKKEELLSNENTKQVLRDVFSIDSKTNLGTFEIPGDEAFINFYISVGDLDDVAKMEGYSTQKSNNIKKNYKKNSDSHAISLKVYNSLKKGESEKDKETTTTGGGDDSTYNRIDTLNEFDQEKITNTSSANSATDELLVAGGALFKSIQIELREGGIVDTRVVFISTDKKTEFYFEGRYPISILNYTRKSKDSYIAFSHYVSLDGSQIYDENILEKLLIRYVDVLDYHPNAGSNYVPDDVSYKFPSNDDESEAKIKDRRSYQVINNTHLQNVLDLRAYTDLLGLFSDEDNGLFQIEGKADFFINPFNVKREALYFLKKVSPYVRYSRFDDDAGFVQATGNVVTDSNGMMSTEYLLQDSKLELLERANLEMGSNLNLINFRWFKESPFWTSLYFPLSYNVTKVRTDATIEDNDANYKIMGFGLGANLEIRRFNNFGLNIGYELKGYSFVGDYSEFNIQEPGYLKTQTINAEIFYYPGSDRSNSIFLRMKNVRDVGSGAGDAFFQLQVGYRFTIGVGAIKAR